MIKAKVTNEDGQGLNIDNEGNLVGVGSTSLEENVGNNTNGEVSSADIRKELFEGDNIRTRQTDRAQREAEEQANIDMTVSEKKED